MTSFAKTAAVLLCVCILLSASTADAGSIRGRELQASIANCRSTRVVGGGRRVCSGCTNGYALIPGDGGCARQATTAVRGGGYVAPRGAYQSTTAVRGGGYAAPRGAYHSTTAVRGGGGYVAPRGAYRSTTAVRGGGGRGGGGAVRRNTAVRGH